jgi:hypothetical protein
MSGSITMPTGLNTESLQGFANSDVHVFSAKADASRTGRTKTSLTADVDRYATIQPQNKEPRKAVKKGIRRDCRIKAIPRRPKRPKFRNATAIVTTRAH